MWIVGSAVFALPDGGFVEDVATVLECLVKLGTGGFVSALKIAENMGFGGHGRDTGDTFGIAEEAGLSAHLKDEDDSNHSDDHVAGGQDARPDWLDLDRISILPIAAEPVWVQGVCRTSWILVFNKD